MSVLTASGIRQAEKEAVSSGIFSFRELMKTAGECVANEIMSRFDIKNKKIAVVCGRGNNAGDGFVCADILSNVAKVEVIIPFGEPDSEDAKYYFSRLSSVEIKNELSAEYDFIVDALFGTGLNRDLDKDCVRLIEKMNESSAVRISVDIPSGAECDTGAVLGACVKAEMTVTFIARKPCLLLPPASDYCGEICVADIGVAPKNYDYRIIKEPKTAKRRKNAHKGDFGTGLMITGSYGMCGAAILAARGALRNGIGILKAVIGEDIYAPFTVAVPEAVCLPENSGEFGTVVLSEKAYKAVESADAVLIGCGMGNNADTKRAVSLVIKRAKSPIIIDADGINAVVPCINILREAASPIIITPHPGEMARIHGVTAAEIEKNRIYFAKKTACDLNVTVVLKGANTIVATPSGEIYFNLTGNSGMATGGSGDVLAGMILAFLARGFTPERAARDAVYLHGKAGDKAKLNFGEEGLLPSDIIDSIESVSK